MLGFIELGNDGFNPVNGVLISPAKLRLLRRGNMGIGHNFDGMGHIVKNKQGISNAKGKRGTLFIPSLATDGMGSNDRTRS